MGSLKIWDGSAWTPINLGLGNPAEAYVSASAPGAPATGTMWFDTDETASGIAASAISFASTGTIAATDVQSAIAEVANEYPSNGAWTTFTPTFTAGVTALGNASVQAKYKALGDKTVLVHCGIIFGTTSTFAAGVVTMNVPFGTAVPPPTFSNVVGPFQTIFNPSGSFINQIGNTRLTTAGRFTFDGQTGTTTLTPVNGSHLGNGAALIFSATYEIS